MNIRAVGEAAGAAVETVLGEIGDAVTMAALDSALAAGLARHCDDTSAKNALYTMTRTAWLIHSIRAMVPSVLN